MGFISMPYVAVGGKKGVKWSRMSQPSHILLLLFLGIVQDQQAITLELERPHEGHVTAGSLEKECVKQYVGS